VVQEVLPPASVGRLPAAGAPAGDEPGAARRRRGRVLVFVVAYRAENFIVSVFERVPKELFDDERFHFLVIDDASPDDRGVELLREWVRAREIGNVTVTRNPVNQGYGGNQKLGYRQAIDAGFDFVILLHGDGQYAPELLPRFVEIWERSGADVVLGSRMGDLRSARAGGMPVYKMAGNRLLTTIQNRLIGLSLSEYHTGYRGYSTRFLRQVPFEIDTNDFHFDTEILLQAAHVGARIEEFDIPTHYGDEDCHVDGIDYSRNVLRETLRWRLHRMGMLCSLKYRDLAHHGPPVDGIYSAHAMALDVVREARPRRVLDVGCGGASLARRLEELGVEVTGLDRREPPPGSMSHFRPVDLDRPLPVDAFDYDLVLLLDVLEELDDPERFLLGLRNSSRALRPGAEGPLVVVATPNVAFVTNRIALLFGRFNYADRGILDIAHKRLFNRVSLRRMLRDCGYRIEAIRPVPVPGSTVIGGRFGRVLERVSGWLARLWPSAFAFQFLVTCRPLPGVEQVLGDRERLAPASVRAES
jgi:2-polyprenyl-3-methyl-5-hydroxy-6-metoxy-1,4-benzoquinol methylase